MAVATLTVDFVARLGNLESAFNRSAQLSKQQATAIESAYGGAASTIKNLGAAIAGAFTVGSITAAIRATVDGLDALNDASDATGISVERLSGLQNYIEGFGGSINDVTGLVLSMQRALSKAGDEDSKGVGKALAAIGLDAEELRRQAPDEALLRIARALDQVEEGGAKTRVIQTIFKDAQNAAPALKDLAGAGELNATVTQEQAERAEQFNQQLAAMQREVRGAARDLVSDLLPALQGYGRELRAIKNADLTFRDLLKLGLNFKSVGENIKELTADLDALNKRRVVAEKNGAPEFFLNGIDVSIEGTKRRLKYFKELQLETALAENKATYSNEARGLDRPAPKKAIAFDGGTATPKAKVAKDAIADSIEEFTIKEQKAVDRELTDMREKREKKATETAKRIAKSEVDAQEEIDRANEKTAKQTAALVERYQDLADPTRKYRLELENIAALGRTLDEQGNPLLSPEEVKKATDAVNEQVKALDKSKSFAEEFGLTMTSAFEDAIVQGKGLRDMLSGISQDIARIIIRKSITEPLGNAVSSFTKSIDWSSLFKFADGGIMTSAGPVPLRKYSGGGIANSPQAAIFAEGGIPEAFVPVPSGKIPVEIRGATGGVTVVQHINIDSRTDASSIRVMMAQARDEAVVAVRTELSRGGSMARLVGKS